MRFLLDTYIQAERVRDGRRLRGHRPHPAHRRAGRRRDRQAARRASRSDPEAVAETITNNIRKVIIDERAINPKYYDKMSRAARRAHRGAPPGRDRLQGVPREAARRRRSSSARRSRTRAIRSGPTTAPRERSIDFGSRSRTLAVEVDDAIRAHQAGRLGRQPDEGEEGQASASREALPADFDRLDELFELVKARHEYR